MESLVRSEFDSEALQVDVAKLSFRSLSEENLRKALNIASREKYQVVFLNALLEDAKAVQQFAQRSGHYCAKKVTYRILINESLISALGHYTKSQDIIEFDGVVPCSKLIELSKHAGYDTRYMNDPNMRYTQFESVYTAWIHNSVAGKVADVVLTARKGSSISGMVTVKKKNSDVVSIGLLAVDPQHRRLGIGVALVVSALSWALDRGRNICEIATQETNKNARELYEKCGGILTSTSMDFHFWLGTRPFNDPVMSSSIPYNVPYVTGGEITNLHEVFESKKVETHGKFGKQCQERLQIELGALKVLMVTSGTSALELCSLAINTVNGDEIIMPSYTFVSTATAFVNHGGTPVFVDIRRDTQNIDETKIEAAITEKTKAIVVVHYAGVPCEMDTIMSIASRHDLFVIEDNAHGIFSTYKSKPLGSIGHLGAHSFHYTKNLSCGEGGAVFVNAPELIAPSMIAWEKGTNRFDFLSGKVDKYAWVDRGSSFILSEINASVLASQLEQRTKIFAKRDNIWESYNSRLRPLQEAGKITLPHVPVGCTHNSHIFYIRVLQKADIKRLVELSKERRIGIFTHYVPLHMSTGGKKYARVSGEMIETLACNDQLCRLPLWPGLTDKQVGDVVALVFEAFHENS